MPMAERIQRDLQHSSGKDGSASSSKSSPRAIVLCPTRELARQVAVEAVKIAPRLKVLACYGGHPLQDNCMSRCVAAWCGVV